MHILSTAGAIALASTFLSAQTPLLELRGNAVNTCHGFGAGNGGDIDKDGFADVLVGNPCARNGDGIVRVYSGRTGQTLAVLRGPQGAGAKFGNSVTTMGDANADGYPDILVGMPNHPKNGLDSGGLQLFSGKDFSLMYTKYGDGIGDIFAFNIGGAGDLNGDGHDEFIVGCPENSGDPTLHYGVGYVRIFNGKDGSTIATLRGLEVGNEFGSSVGKIPDLDGDGTNDLLIGSNLGDDGLGTAEVYSGRTLKRIHKFEAYPEGDHFGISMADAGDVDRDGLHDVVVGAINIFTLVPIKGSLSVYSGRTGKRLYSIYGGPNTGALGRVVAGAGDVDGDGYADFMGGDPADHTLGTKHGSVRIYSGRTGRPLHTIYGDGGGFGKAIAAIPDLTMDGKPEVLVTAQVARYGGMRYGKAEVFSVDNVAAYGAGCAGAIGTAPFLDATQPQVGKPLTVFLRNASASTNGVLLLGRVPMTPTPLVGPCTAYLDLGRTVILTPWTTDRAGRCSLPLTVPASASLVGQQAAMQGAVGPSASPLGTDLSNGVYVTIDR